MTTTTMMTAITFNKIPVRFDHPNLDLWQRHLSRAEFGTAFGQAFATLPLGQEMTATEIRDAIAPGRAIQKMNAYLKKAVKLGFAKREWKPNGKIFIDEDGVEHQVKQAFYKRI